MVKSLVAIVFSATLFSGFSLAEDSTGTVVNGLTMAENFQGATQSGEQVIYSGATSGRINLPAGLTKVIVNGRTHHIGTGGTTFINILGGTTYPVNTCYIKVSNTENGSNRCINEKPNVTVPDCKIIIADGYVQGCNTRRTIKAGVCIDSACKSLGQISAGGVGYVRSVVGVSE